MRYGFINNFSQALAADLASDSISMDIDAGGDLLADATTSDVYNLTLEDDSSMEIVRVRAASGNTLTIVRSQEGTSAKAWPAGTKVELRMTAAAADSMIQIDSPTIWGSGNVQASDPDPDLVAIGDFYATGDGPQVAIGSANAYAPNATSVGVNVRSNGERSTTIGYELAAEAGGTAIGNLTYAGADAIAIGSAGGTYAMNGAYGDKSIALGYECDANQPFSISMGAGALANVAGGLLIYGIPYLRQVVPTPMTNQPPASLKVASQAVFALDPIDLTTAGATATLGLPSSCAVYIDSIEIVVTSSSSPGGTPEVKVGTDGTNTDNLLAATALTALTVRHRQKHSPSTDDGVIGVRAEVVTAGTGTIQARVIVRCYVLEE